MNFLRSIKFRLTLWFLAAILLMLAVFGTFSYYLLKRSLVRNLNDSLRDRFIELASSTRFDGERFFFNATVGELVMFYDADGALKQTLGPAIQADLGRIIELALVGDKAFQTVKRAGGSAMRLLAGPYNAGGGGDRPQKRFALVIGRSTNDIVSVLAIFRMVSLNSSFLVLLLAGAGGIFLAGRTLKPVDQIAETARGIGESDLSRRIDVLTDDELGRLAATLNGMIGRLEEAFKKERQFVADASHELRTPLAIIQAESSLALEKTRTQDEYRRSLELVSQEIDFMSEVVGKMLLLARSDSGAETLDFEDIKLKPLLMELAQDVDLLVQDKGLKLELGPMEELKVRGDRVKLKQLFLNVLDNAVRYTPPGGTITAALGRRDGRAVASIADTGIGIPAEHLPFVFDRFYRADKARTASDGGTGLGLSIALSVAKMHGGAIEVESEPGKGTTVRVALPLAATRQF
ncbi:MAG TPA: ATP-binding protein [Candidatus Aminicenantes bacterium]|nr:ATP-binding protein [Candidatus Aminicenantes bacterium]